MLKVSPVIVGKTLRELEYAKSKTRSCRFWKVTEIQPLEIETFIPGGSSNECNLPFRD